MGCAGFRTGHFNSRLRPSSRKPADLIPANANRAALDNESGRISPKLCARILFGIEWIAFRSIKKLPSSTTKGSGENCATSSLAQGRPQITSRRPVWVSACRHGMLMQTSPTQFGRRTIIRLSGLFGLLTVNVFYLNGANRDLPLIPEVLVMRVS